MTIEETRKNLYINISVGILLSVIIAVAASVSNCATEDTQAETIRSVPNAVSEVKGDL
ncbi:MAG: hypothetical protein NC203_00460 [Firmicutes bacterium]|nr:hypothetical protein [[Eubacterium] siraeum]MCM1486811.1 hypothetical protein [Bacillota bacterium]